ncbi:MAG: radical SAM/SPASM domain-containing protein [Christensenellales bacterium]|jgi:radical SAM protein with 4Fe4S-binding SPASM domain
MNLTDVIRDCGEHDEFDAFTRYLRHKAWEEGKPLVGLFELTPRCTLDCRMCYVHLEPGQMRRRELTTEEWISIIDEACDAGMLYATLSGGECTMYPGFRQIYEHLQARGTLVTVFTNGTLLDAEMVSWLAARKPKRVQLSVYGSSPEGYRAVTGHADAFYRVDRAIDLLQKADIALDLAVTVSKQMLPDFEAILRYCESKGINHYNVSSSTFDAREETGRVSDDYATSLDEQIAVIKTQRRLRCVRNGMDENEPPKPNPNPPVCPETGVVCLAGRGSFSVNWRGEMSPCNTLHNAGGEPLVDGFLPVWREMNRRCVEYRNPPECVGCEYYPVCRFCPGGHYMRVGEGRVNPSVCVEAKRMVEEKIQILQ